MEFPLSKDQLLSFYFWVGVARLYVMWGLFILSFLLVCLGFPKEKNAKIVTLPCILCALLSFIVFYVYFMEIVVAFQSGAKYEMEAFKLRLMGPYWYYYVIQYVCMCVPILLAFSYFRKSPWRIMVITIIGLIAIHLESLVIYLTTTSRI